MAVLVNGVDPIRLPGVPLTDPAWSEARRGRPSANSGHVLVPEVLSPDEVGALMRRCSPRTPSGVRNRALIAVMHRAGLRVGEVVGRDFRPRTEPKGPQETTERFPGLFVRDLDAANGLIRVTYGKGNGRKAYKPRTVAIDPGGIAHLELWIAKRRELGIPPRVQLFCTISDDEDRYGGQWRALSTIYVRNMLGRLARGAGIDRRVHPHALRHTHAFELAMEGWPLHMIQAQLGHESLATTGRYLAHIAPAALAEAMSARPWPEQVPAA